eukprot:4598176-Pleurochrysis_carterae.AAC.1
MPNSNGSEQICVAHTHEIPRGCKLNIAHTYLICMQECGVWRPYNRAACMHFARLLGFLVDTCAESRALFVLVNAVP